MIDIGGPVNEKMADGKTFVVCYFRVLSDVCELFHPKLFRNIHVNADAVSFAVNKSSAVIHFDKGVNACHNVFSGWDPSFFDGGDDAASVMFRLMEVFKKVRIPTLLHT